MSEDSYNRSVALDRALQFWAEKPDQGDRDVLKTAEAFRAFLAGETKEKATQNVLPAFKLPRFSDEYVYFQFEDSSILYRSDIGYGSTAPGSVSRINSRVESEWLSIDGKSALGTRDKLRNSPGYPQVTSRQAAEVLKAHVKGVRFE